MYQTVLKMVLSFFPKILTKSIEEVVFIHIVKKKNQYEGNFSLNSEKSAKNDPQVLRYFIF